jgi:uncharacterized protein YqjF (DUF2071 family)
MSWLQQHPFAVKAHFDRVVALSYALPSDVLRPLLPRGLALDEYNGFGFLTVAMVWTKEMRPAFMPKFLGRSFFLAGYRIFTRLSNDQGKTMRGLYIIGSETDRDSIVFLANRMTGYRYEKISLAQQQETLGSRIIAHDSRNQMSLDIHFEEKDDAELPHDSPFPDWRKARQFAGPMPFTFSPLGDRSFVVVEGARESWTPRPVVVHHAEVAKLHTPPFSQTKPILANAFAVSDVDYHWKKGVIMKGVDHA